MKMNWGSLAHCNNSDDLDFVIHFKYIFSIYWLITLDYANNNVVKIIHKMFWLGIANGSGYYRFCIILIKKLVEHW